MVDYFSRYIEVKMMKTTNAQKIVGALDEIFSRSIRTDNGTQFIAQEFADYMRE